MSEDHLIMDGAPARFPAGAPRSLESHVSAAAGGAVTPRRGRRRGLKDSGAVDAAGPAEISWSSKTRHMKISINRIEPSPENENQASRAGASRR